MPLQPRPPPAPATAAARQPVVAAVAAAAVVARRPPVVAGRLLRQRQRPPLDWTGPSFGSAVAAAAVVGDWFADDWTDYFVSFDFAAGSTTVAGSADSAGFAAGFSWILLGRNLYCGSQHLPGFLLT